MYNISNLQQQKATPGATPVTQEQKTKATIHTDTLKLENNNKTLLGLMTHNFCWDVQMVGPEFGIYSMKAWIHPSLYDRFRLVVDLIV